MNERLPSATLLSNLPRPTTLHVILLPLLFVGVVLARWIVLATFGSDAPYWDQWDGEIAGLYKPFMDGTLSLQQLLSAHNEHRIFFSRLFNLGLFAANGAQFDNLVEAYAASVLYAFALSCFAWPILVRLRGSDLLLGWLVALLIGVAPYAPENLLVGFQNAFYFLTLFAAWAIAAAAMGKSRGALALALMLALASQFVLASGLLLGPAVAFVAVLRWHTAELTARPAVTMALAGLIIGIGGYVAVPVLEHHAPLRAQGVTDFIQAALTTTSWPLPGSIVSAALIWAPSAIMLWRIVRRRESSGIDLYLLGLGAWVFLQQIAVAHTRGHGLLVVPSRYTDLMALAPAINLALIVRLWQLPAGRAWRAAVATLGGISTVAMMIGLLWVSTHGAAYLIRTADNSALSRANLRAYLSGQGARAFAGQPGQAISYPVAERLDMLLQDPVIRDMLPPSIRLPVPATLESCAAFEPFGAYPTTPAVPGAMGSYRATLGNASVGTCSTSLFTLSRPYFLVNFAGYPLKPGMSLALRDVNQRSFLLRPAVDPQENWFGTLQSTPGGGPFVLTGIDSDPSFWFAFTPPVEIGRLSALRLKLGEKLDIAPTARWH